MAKVNNKTFLFLGILFILVAFGCAILVTYQMFTSHQEKAKEVQTIKEKFLMADQEKVFAEREAQDLAKRVGKEIVLERLVAVSEKKYGQEERARKQGDLWIDRAEGNWMITLGLLNGVEKGSRLRVLEGSDTLGIVAVERALDVVSYVYPLEDSGQYTQDFYRVVVE